MDECRNAKHNISVCKQKGQSCIMLQGPLGLVLSYRSVKTFQRVANEDNFFDWSNSSERLDVFHSTV